MTVAEKLTTIAENEQKVFDAGKDAGTDAFWDVVQNGGNRNDYSYAFIRWDAEYIRPKYKVAAYNSRDGLSTFNACGNLKKVEAAYFDFSQKPTDNSSNNGGYNYTFNECRRLEEVEDIGLNPQSIYHATFYACNALHTIARIGVDENTRFYRAFIGCYELQNLTVDGVIGQDGFDVGTSTKLTHDSLMSIINALESKTEGTWTVTLGATNLAKMTDAEKAIATEKGWTLA